MLAIFVPEVGTTQIGRAPFDRPSGKRVDLATADVELAEAGMNVTILRGDE